MLLRMLRRRLLDKPEQARPELATEEPTEEMIVMTRKRASKRTQERKEH